MLNRCIGKVLCKISPSCSCERKGLRFCFPPVITAKQNLSLHSLIFMEQKIAKVGRFEYRKRRKSIASTNILIIVSVYSNDVCHVRNGNQTLLATERRVCA